MKHFMSIVLVLAGVPVLAHHSVQAEFDLSKPIAVTGVVTNGLFARRGADVLLLGTKNGVRTFTAK